jgi:DNA-binding MarR family transcriptional regulator
MVLLTAEIRCRTSEDQERGPVPSLKRAEKSSATEGPIELGPLAENVGYLVRRAQVTIFQRFFELFAEADIRPVQYSILTVIESNPGLSQKQLAAALGIKKTNLVGLIDELEARGLARRKPTESDRRSHALYLTRKGTVLIARLHRLDASLNQRIARMMSAEERRRLCEILRQVAAL